MAKRKTSRKRANRQPTRDDVFPPLTRTVTEAGAAMAARKGTPDIDYRAALFDRFGIDGEKTPSELDRITPGEPDRYDYADIHEAHTLAYVPLWLIDASQVKLLHDYGYDSRSTFFLGILMLERDPFLDVDGSVVGPLLPAMLKRIGKASDPAEIDALGAVLTRAQDRLSTNQDEPDIVAANKRILTNALEAFERRRRS